MVQLIAGYSTGNHASQAVRILAERGVDLEPGSSGPGRQEGRPEPADEGEPDDPVFGGPIPPSDTSRQQATPSAPSLRRCNR